MDRHIDRQEDRLIDRQTKRQLNNQIDRKIDNIQIQIYDLMDKKIDGQADRYQIDKFKKQ